VGVGESHPLHQPGRAVGITAQIGLRRIMDGLINEYRAAA